MISNNNNVGIQDEPQRLRALNPSLSFIVQAPAGSGKTELLAQRVLALLSQTQAPEEILAITFTKKAASEMRNRIISALQKANYEAEPLSDHGKKTWALAKKVLLRDQALGWNILANPNRLRIQTIDSFNVSLTKYLPLLSHFGATPEITTDPESLYKEAVQEFLAHLEENVAWSDAIALLLKHRDND
jgi:ATP-dependent helicase/nuclease subunit A